MGDGADNIWRFADGCTPWPTDRGYLISRGRHVPLAKFRQEFPTALVDYLSIDNAEYGEPPPVAT